MSEVYVIAEAGVNHNGDLTIAQKLIDVAAEAGANAVKFQSFKADKLVSKSSQKAKYQSETTDPSESQHAMLKRLELSEDDHKLLVTRCADRNIDFLSTAFDDESLHLLSHVLHLNTLKIPSGDLTNSPLLLEHARTGANLIVSTGMATLDEIQLALGVISHGYLYPDYDGVLSEQIFMDTLDKQDAQELLQRKLVLLHCTTEYPAPFEDINLKAMDTMAEKFGIPVGYSDHSVGISVSIAAVARGARVIEKHFTLDRSMEGPDHKASIEPDTLTEMVRSIREVERALGDGVKQLQPSEVANRDVARKSLHANRAIKAGEVFTEQNLCLKRPGSGLEPKEYWRLLGKPAERSFDEGEMISG